MLTAISGALAGLIHVLAGPDHLAAVAPLALADRRRGWVSGWTWGIGHASGVVVVTLGAIALREALPPVEAIAIWGERLVGAALVLVGAWGLRRGLRIHPGRHRHGTTAHDHLHVHAGPAWFRRLGHAHASFYLGVLHGIAGSAHFLGVVPALALPTRAAAVTYVLAFGLGTVAAMTSFGALAGAAGAWGDRAKAGRFLAVGSAMLAMVVGGIWQVAPPG